MINLYCDESCHLENDKINIMVLGALAVPEFAKTTVFEEVKKNSEKYGYIITQRNKMD